MFLQVYFPLLGNQNSSYSPSMHAMVDGGVAKVDQSEESPMYTKMDDAIECILQHGMEIELLKLNLNSAHHIVPIHPQEQQLLRIAVPGQC